MGMPAPQSVTTIDQLLALPDDGLTHELLDGEHVVTPVPRPNHERIVLALWLLIRDAVRDRPDLETFGGKAEIRLGPRTLVQPDVLLIENPGGARIKEWIEAPVPLLAVEVLSPSSAGRDRGRKRELYLEAGVEEYWVVDVDACRVERWRRGDALPETVDTNLRWSLSVGIGGEIDLPRLFAKLPR